MTHFAFLYREWSPIYEAANRAESAAHADPRTACFYARRTLELAVAWAYKHDASLKLPYQDNLSALIHEPTFKAAAGDAVFTKARLINTLGNQAVHGSRTVTTNDAITAVREIFHVCYWFARAYSRLDAPLPSERFNPESLPPANAVPKQTAEQLRQLEKELEARDEKLSLLLADKESLDAELTRLRAELAVSRLAVAAVPDTHDYSEAETRDYFIDLLLREAGWPLNEARDREFEVQGMRNNHNVGYVDYVLWGDDGKPLGLVEAKRTKHDPRVGQQQAKLYADCLEQMYGQRPVIFYSNGYTHWIWDDERYPPREVQGFYKKSELALLIQRRTTRRALGSLEINNAIIERYYQTRGIRRIGEAFEKDHDRKALLVMATGAGKTRTVIALSDLLIRANWAKRILFLADRVALVKQAANAFKRFLPDSSPVNLVTEPEGEGRVFVSTYPTMMGMIDDTAGGERRFGVGHFDLVVIDEAHRSVFQKYRAIFDYFDSLLVGLTATPKDELDRNTYSLFELESGVPTDAYSLDEAVRDGFLVPPEAVSVPLKFQRTGIAYDELSEDEKEQWDAVEWSDDGSVPKHIDQAAMNRWLFNTDTVDKVLAHLMTRGVKVAGGDRLGKTIIFAANRDHANFIDERFNANYPHYKGAFARVITHKVEYAESLIEDFSSKEKSPHIAISVDMLDTGIDVPEAVNLVFFKLVRSKTKFWQMVGRGTRLCPDLLGPGDDKKFFFIFDYCGNLEFFSQQMPTTEGSVAPSLGKRLFVNRLALIGELDRRSTSNTGARELSETAAGYLGPANEGELRRSIGDALQGEVAAMNLDNFVVRPWRRSVERFAKPEAWTSLSAEALSELEHEVAGLPSEIQSDGEDAKRFDLLILNLQLARLRASPGFVKLRDQAKILAGLLEDKSTIPMIREQLSLIQEIQGDAWWDDVTVAMLEGVRRRLRLLIRLIEKKERKPIYTDFEDEIGEETSVALPGVGEGQEFARFRDKAQRYLRAHLDHIAILKLRTNKALTPADIAELEGILIESGVGGMADINRAKIESQGLGLFVRSLVGMDRSAAKDALAGFIDGKSLTANQITFVNLIIDHLTQHGVMVAARLYESPFSDIAPQGPDGLFAPNQVDLLINVLDGVRATAQAA